MKNELLALLTDRPEDIDWAVCGDLSHPALLWVKDYKETYGELPTLELFAEECLEEGERPKAQAPWSYYVREHQNLLFVEEATKYLDTFNRNYALDPKKAILQLRDEFQRIQAPSEQTFIPAEIVSQTPERWEYFTQKKGARLQTGIKEFDEVSGGISPDDEFMVLSARLGQGKALKYGTKVLGADGLFRPVEDFRAGEYLVGVDGRPTKILKVRDFDRLNLYRVHFIDGTYIDCCEDHLWTLRIGNRLVTLSTKELATKKLKDVGAGTGTSQNKGNNYWRYYLPKISPVATPEKQYVIPPYTMGVLLGDGTISHQSTVQFTSFDEEIVDAVESELPDSLILGKLKGEGGYSIKWKKRSTTKNPYAAEITRLGLWGRAWEKHIPKEYMQGSPEQRLELLAGIIDTDGYIYSGFKGVRTSGVYLTLTSEQLIDDVRAIIESLGGYARKRSDMGYYKVEGVRRYTRMTYTLSFQLPFDLPLRGPKKERFRVARVFRTRPVVAVEPIEPAGGRCFIVDNTEHLFLTEHYIPTHNSMLLHLIALNLAKQGHTVGLYSGEMTEYEVGARVDAWLTHISNWELTRGKLTDSTAQVQAYKDEVPGKILVLTPKQIGHNATPRDLRRFCKEQNVTAMLIDQLSLMVPDGRQSGEMHVQFASLSMQLKSLQQDLRIPFIAVSQLNRAAQEQEINAANISGSDRIGQDATIILALERPKINQLTIRVLKARGFAPPNQPWNYTWDIDRGILSNGDTSVSGIKEQAAATKKGQETENAARALAEQAEQHNDETDDPNFNYG